MAEDEIASPTDNKHELEQTQGDSGGQRSLAWCSPWGCKESDTTERWNNTQMMANVSLKDSKALR